MAATFDLKGFDDLAKRLTAAGEETINKAKQALRVEAEQVRTEAVRKHVPRDLGTLAGSIRVGRVQELGGDMEVRITAGDSSAPYALAVHEHPSDSSPPSWRGKAIEDIKSVRGRNPWSIGEGQRGPKYIERPLMAAAKGMAERIGKAIKL